MEILKIESTPSTPKVKFDPFTGRLELKGRSVSENSLKFYKPLLAAVDSYIVNPVSPTTVDIYFDYFNTVTSRCVLDLLKRLEGLPQRGIKVEVNWYYTGDDDYMRDAGMDYKAIIKLDINIVKI